MNHASTDPAARSMRLGLALFLVGVALAVSAAAGLWLAWCGVALAPVVLGVWPVLFMAAGLFLVGHAVGTRRAPSRRAGEEGR